MANATSTPSLFQNQLTIAESEAQRFWSKVAKSESPGECWLWTGCTHEFGYGVFRFSRSRKNSSTHRFSYLLKHGFAPSVVRHVCDNPICVNPDHLIPGSHADNVGDRVERGRSAKGAMNGRAKLTEGKVFEILDRTHAGETKASLAREFEVDPKAIQLIAAGKTWAHVFAIWSPVNPRV